MYVIEVTYKDSGQVTYVEEYTSSGKKYLDFPCKLHNAKTWKSLTGANQGQEKFLKINHRTDKLKKILVKEVTEEDIEKSKNQSEEEKLHKELDDLRRNCLRRSYASSVLNEMLLKKAEALSALKPGDKLRHYQNLENFHFTFEIVSIDKVAGLSIWVKEKSYSRINGYSNDRKEMILPNDDILSKYFLAYKLATNVRWGDMPVNQIIQIASLVQDSFIQ
jgi:hypothetical protein